MWYVGLWRWGYTGDATSLRAATWRGGQWFGRARAKVSQHLGRLLMCGAAMPGALLLVVCLTATSLHATFLKCCPRDQQLAVDFESCEPSNASRLEDEYPWWLPENATALSSDTREPIRDFFLGEAFQRRVQAGGAALCGASSITFFAKVDEFKYLDDGSLVGVFRGAVDEETLPALSSCADRVTLDNVDYRLVVVCPCKLLPCLRRCCPPSTALSPSLECEYGDPQDNNATWRFADDADERLFVAVSGNNFCQHGMYELEGGLARGAVVRADGSLLTADEVTSVPAGQFCLDEQHVLVCGLQSSSTFGVLFVLGCVVLTATLLAQLLQPHRGGHTRYLMAHIASLLVTYLVLAAEHLSPYPPPQACYFIALSIQFSFLAAMFWLNVMCFDIAWSFSVFRVPKGTVECQNKRFILYSLYAWGSSGIITIITIIIEFSPTGDMVIKPSLAVVSCWFQGDLATFGYFYGPVSCLLLVNLVLFIYTVVRIFELRRSTAVLRQTDSALHRGKGKEEDQMKESFMLVLKLFCLMGVTWMIEIISWAIKDPSYYWYISDIVNVNRSLFIFILFCCKRNVWKHMQLRLHYVMPRCVPKPNVDQEKERSSSGHTDSSRFSSKSSVKSTRRKKSSDSNAKETGM